MTGKESDTTKLRCVQLTPTYAIASFAVSDLRNFKKVKKYEYFGNARQFCYCWSETADEGDGRIMMGDKADGEVVMLRSIRLHKC